MSVFYQAQAGGIESLVEGPKHDRNYKCGFCFVFGYHHFSIALKYRHVVKLEFVIVINLLVEPIGIAMNALKDLSLVRQLTTFFTNSNTNYCTFQVVCLRKHSQQHLSNYCLARLAKCCTTIRDTPTMTTTRLQFRLCIPGKFNSRIKHRKYAHTGCFLHWASPKMLKYVKPRLGESTLTQIILDIPNLAQINFVVL